MMVFVKLCSSMVNFQKFGATENDSSSSIETAFTNKCSSVLQAFKGIHKKKTKQPTNVRSLVIDVKICN